MLRVFAAGLAVSSVLCAGAAQAAEVLLAKPQMTAASRQADIDDCFAIYDRKPRDPAMVAATTAPTPPQPQAQPGTPMVVVMPSPTPAGAGVSMGAVAGAGVFAYLVMSQAAREDAMNLCLRQRGYVEARLTRKELGAFRERVPVEQGPWIDGLVKSGRLEEATRPLVAPLPRVEGFEIWRIVPGSLKVEAGEKARGEVIATAQAELAHEARLKSELVVSPKWTVPAGAVFFRALGSRAGGIGMEPVWCTRMPAPKQERQMLCLFDGNNGYNVVVGLPGPMLGANGPLAAADLVTTVELEALDAPSKAFPVSFVANRTFGGESLVGAAGWEPGEVEMHVQTFNARDGVDKPAKNGEVLPDVDAAPVELTVGDQVVVVSATGKGKARRYEAVLAAR